MQELKKGRQRDDAIGHQTAGIIFGFYNIVTQLSMICYIFHDVNYPLKNMFLDRIAMTVISVLLPINITFDYTKASIQDIKLPCIENLSN